MGNPEVRPQAVRLEDHNLNKFMDSYGTVFKALTNFIRDNRFSSGVLIINPFPHHIRESSELAWVHRIEIGKYSYGDILEIVITTFYNPARLRELFGDMEDGDKGMFFLDEISVKGYVQIQTHICFDPRINKTSIYQGVVRSGGSVNPHPRMEVPSDKISQELLMGMLVKAQDIVGVGSSGSPEV